MAISIIVSGVLFSVSISLYLSECLGNSCLILGICLIGFLSE